MIPDKKILLYEFYDSKGTLLIYDKYNGDHDIFRNFPEKLLDVTRIVIFSTSEQGGSLLLSNLNEFEIYTTEMVPPSKVSGLTANEGDTEVYLNWSPNPETDIAKYRIYKDGELIYESVLTYYTVRYLENDRQYEFCVSAVSTRGLEGEKSCITATPRTPDIVPPPAPFELQGIGSHEMVRLTWKYEHVGDFSHFYVYRDGVRIGGKVLFPAYTDREVENDVTYTYYVTAVDKSGNESEPSNSVEVTPYDDRPPPIPPPDPNDITNPDIREIGKGMFDVFESAKSAGLLIVIAAILLGVIFIVSRWLWRLLKRWFAKSGSFGRR